jgi:uncharacterized protein (DUF1800 family)
MNSSADTQAFIAANKFGLGIRPGELPEISKNPKAWLKDQLRGIATLPDPMASLPHSSALFIEDQASRIEIQRLDQASDDPQARQRFARQQQQDITRQRREQMGLRHMVAVSSDAPFAERLIKFWSNHFTIAISGGNKTVLQRAALPYENEAIRQHMAGDFASLLIAVEQHPVMLVYLDNINSIGPNSRAAQVQQRQQRGLNENLAREILELHSLGVNGGYSQADVTSLAKIITGWSVFRGVADRGQNNPAVDTAEVGRFQFQQPAHEPGTHVLLGMPYGNAGLKQGEDALTALANHPATARHIATKLATHFIADAPPASAITALEKVFTETGGSLPVLHDALVDLDAAWQPRYRKLKTPEELLISTARGLNMNFSVPGGERLIDFMGQTLLSLNQAPFTAPSPAGWPDSAEHWGSPDALLKRIEWANQIAERVPVRFDPSVLYSQLLPDNEVVRLTIARAESPKQGLALLLGGPDFQWR